LVGREENIMSPALLVVVVILVAMVWLIARLANQNAALQALDRRERAELLHLRALVDDLKETAWDHRELDSALSTIIIDKIRSHERQERRGRELGP
jgi:hypothetical protein